MTNALFLQSKGVEVNSTENGVYRVNVVYKCIILVLSWVGFKELLKD